MSDDYLPYVNAALNGGLLVLFRFGWAEIKYIRRRLDGYINGQRVGKGGDDD